VRVNSLHPGQIDTDMNARRREQTPEMIIDGGASA
jgi:NAD(P)-dependent dehydrogenase (short-subunit alcohol dehydrogenase family)